MLHLSSGRAAAVRSRTQVGRHHHAPGQLPRPLCRCARPRRTPMRQASADKQYCMALAARQRQCARNLRPLLLTAATAVAPGAVAAPAAPATRRPRREAAARGAHASAGDARLEVSAPFVGAGARRLAHRQKPFLLQQMATQKRKKKCPRQSLYVGVRMFCHGSGSAQQLRVRVCGLPLGAYEGGSGMRTSGQWSSGS